MIVGKQAPNFTASALVNGNTQEISLQDYRGKWVILFFYSGDFSFVWPTELATIAVRYNEFKELNAEILAINTDSEYSHKVWSDMELSKMAERSIPYPMLTDIAGTIGQMYDVYDAQNGIDLRGTFIIDPKGYVHGSEILTTPVGRSSSEILRQLKAFQKYVSTGRLMPCDWNSGDKTLSESIELVGKVWAEWKPDKSLYEKEVSNYVLSADTK